MKCGEKGHVTAAGLPCGQEIAATAKACIWHSRTAEERRVLALKGGIASRMNRALPSSYRVPEFADPEAIIGFAQELARLALTEDVDPRRLAEARGAASLALSGHSALTQARLVEALLKVEHGGAANAPADPPTGRARRGPAPPAAAPHGALAAPGRCGVTPGASYRPAQSISTIRPISTATTMAVFRTAFHVLLSPGDRCSQIHRAASRNMNTKATTWPIARRFYARAA